MPSVYRPDNFMGRVNYAAQCVVRGYTNGRHFDTCFEMFDGDAVSVALMRRAEKNPRLKAALVKTFGDGTVYHPRWQQSADMLKDVPTRKLTEEAAKERAEAERQWAAREGGTTT